MTTTEAEEWWDVCRKRFAKREDIPHDLAPTLEIMKQASKAVFARKLASGPFAIVQDLEVQHVHIIEVVEAAQPNESNAPGIFYIEVRSSAKLRKKS